MAELYLNGLKKANSIIDFYKDCEGDGELDENSILSQREGTYKVLGYVFLVCIPIDFYAWAENLFWYAHFLHTHVVKIYA